MNPIVEFGAIERADLAKLRDWRNDLRRNFRQWYPLGMEDQETWFRSIQGRDKHVMFAVWTQAPEPHVPFGQIEPVLIGVVGLTYIDWRTRRAEASIFIGPPQLHDKGYGKAALLELLRFGFDEIGLHCISAEIFEFNVASIKLFESCGFSFEGWKRDAHFAEGRWWPVGMYSILQGEMTR